MNCNAYYVKNLAERQIHRRRFLLHLSGKGFRFRLLVIAVIWLLTSDYSLADKVFLIDGDVIEGIITKQDRSVIVLEHSDLGRVEIARDRIKSLMIDTPDVELVLTDGDTIQGRLVEEDESRIVLEHRDLGRITIQKDRIASSNIEASDATVVMVGGDTIEGKLVERTDFAIVLEHSNLGRLEIPRNRIESLKVKAPEFKKEETSGWFDPPLRKLGAKASRLKEKGWGAAVDLSLDSSTGNTSEQSMRFGGHIDRKSLDRRASLDTSYYYKVKEGEITDNELAIGYIHDWLDPESVWFWFTYYRFDYDEFESWQQRANALAGPGYHLIKNDDMRLDARLALGPRKEWGSQNDDIELEAAFGGDFEWEISEKEQLKCASYFIPTFGDLDDYRGIISAEWRFLFDTDINFSFIVGTEYEYQSLVDPGKDHGDTRTYLGLRYDF